MTKVLHPPHEVPSERVCMGDLLRLGRERSTRQAALKTAVDEMVEFAPLSGKRSLAGRLENVTQLFQEAGALEWQLHLGLSHYQNDLTPVLQLAGDWFVLAKEDYVGLDQEVEGLVERALRS